MSYENNPNPYDAQPQPGGYPQQPGGFPGQPGGYGAGGYGQFGAPALSPDVAPLPGASIGDAIKRFFQRYAQFRGYASRSEFWWVMLFLFILQIVGYVVVVAPLLAAVAASSGDLSTNESGAAAAGAGTLILGFIFLVLFLALIVPTISLSVRRLHDAGQSGWLVLINFVPYVGTIAPIIIGLLPSKPEAYRPEWS